MALYRNTSRGSITFYDPRKPFQEAIPPGGSVDSKDTPDVVGHADFEKLADFWTFCHQRPGSNIAIVRSYALGDVLMVYAILNTIRPELERLNIRVTLFTQRRFHPVFKHTDWVRWAVDERLALIPEIQRQFDVAYSLNGILEKDHETKEHGQENRLRMLAEALGLEGVVET